MTYNGQSYPRNAVMPSAPRDLLRAGLAIALIALLTLGCRDAGPETATHHNYQAHLRQTEVQLAPVVQQQLAATEQFTGDLLPRRRTRLTAEVEGIVQRIPQVGPKFDVSVGDRRYVEQLSIAYGQAVQQGDLLVQLDPTHFQLELTMAEAKLAKAKADLAQLTAWERDEEVRRLAALRDEAAARLAQAKRDRDRMAELTTTQAVTQSQLEQAEMQVATAKAAVEGAAAALAKADAGPTPEEVAVLEALVDQAEAEVQQKKNDLARTAIRAPYDAVVTEINVEVGERVAPTGEPLVELMDLSLLVAEIGVPEAYLGDVRVEGRANVKVAGVTTPVPGLIIAINDLVDPATRTFRVRIAIDNAELGLKAGQFAAVEIPLLGSDGPSLAIPQAALTFVEGEPHVFVVEENRVRARQFVPGISTDGMTEVLSGLAAGEMVVVDDPAVLADGMEVVVRATDKAVALGDSNRDAAAVLQ